MTTPESAGPNAEQSQYWNEVGGPNWVALQEVLDEEHAPLGAVAMDRSEVAPGERVLDIGCGCGHTSLELARRVGPGGIVLVIDISTPMLERAGARAKEAGVVNVRFENADAQSFAFEPSEFDLLYSSGAPGPSAFADSGRVRSILEGAGFADVAFERLDTTITIGGSGSFDESVRNMLRFGLISRAIRQANVQDTTEIAASLREAVAPYATPKGVRMKSACWVVTARRPQNTG